jgi:hypothetical protein
MVRNFLICRTNINNGKEGDKRTKGLKETKKVARNAGVKNISF